ncbi:MAG: DUF4402 domain-containing protein [Chlorobiaceae bacterium]
MKREIVAISCFAMAPLHAFGGQGASTARATASAHIVSSVLGIKETEPPDWDDPARKWVRLATFDVTAEADTHCSVAMPDDDKVKITNGKEVIVVKRFSCYPVGGASLPERSGRSSFRIGGILEIPPKQPPGDYRGSFDVTVSYQ